MIKGSKFPTGTGSRVTDETDGKAAPYSNKPDGNASCTVTVVGFDRNDVLFTSDKANVVKIKNKNGDLSVIIAKINGEIWGYSRRGDPDWNEVVSIYGSDDDKK